MADVADVRVAARVGDLENRPAQVLRIIRASGQARELFTHRDPAELAWVAVVPSRALGLPLRG